LQPTSIEVIISSLAKLYGRHCVEDAHAENVKEHLNIDVEVNGDNDKHKVIHEVPINSQDVKERPPIHQHVSKELGRKPHLLVVLQQVKLCVDALFHELFV